MSLPNFYRLNLGKPTSMAFEIVEMGTLEKTLDTNGVATVSLDSVDSEAFLHALDHCVSKWFVKEARKWFAKENPVTDYPDENKQNSWKKGKKVFERGVGLVDRVVQVFNPGTVDGLEKLFIPEERKAAIERLVNTLTNIEEDEEKPLLYYIDEILKVVKQGGTKMPMRGQHATSQVTHWSLKGFGFWAHIVPSQGIRSQLELQKKLESLGIQARISGLPHLVYKPNKGDALPTHTDGPRFGEILQTIQKLKGEKGGQWPTNTEWCREVGVQCLVHYEGGDSTKQGATYGFGPMNPQKLHVCISALRDKKQDVYNEVASTARDGPAYLKWETHLEFFNKELAANGLSAINIVPICPAARCGTFAALWPVGFPHGSSSNAGRRVTTTAPLTIFKAPNADNHVPDRVRALAQLAHPTDPHEREEALIVIKSQKQPFAGGTTHARPDLVSPWYDRETNGPFADIAPTKEDAERFSNEWNRDRLVPTEAAALIPERAGMPPIPSYGPMESDLATLIPERAGMPLIPPYGPRGSDLAVWKKEKERLTMLWNKNGAWEPKDIVAMETDVVDKVPDATSSLKVVLEALDSLDTVYFNVQEPWASLIAEGVKCVENRPNALLRGDAPKDAADEAIERWAIVIASKPDNLTPNEMRKRNADYERRLKWSGQERVVTVKSAKEYSNETSQCAVAFVRIRSIENKVDQLPTQSIWNNGDKFAWIIQEVFKLEEPVLKGAGSLSVCYLNRPSVAVERATKLRSGTPVEIAARDLAMEKAKASESALKQFKVNVRTQLECALNGQTDEDYSEEEGAKETSWQTRRHAVFSESDDASSDDEVIF